MIQTHPTALAPTTSRRQHPRYGSVLASSPTGLGLPLAQNTLAKRPSQANSPNFAGWLTKGPLNKAFNWLEKQPRGIELIVEDILGFAVLRSVLDTLRGVFYGNDELSWAAGFERFRREAFSVATDLFIPGVAALAIGKVMDSVNGGFSSRFSSLTDAKILGNLIDNLPEDGTPTQLHQHLANTLAESANFKGSTKPLRDWLATPALELLSPNAQQQWLTSLTSDATHQQRVKKALHKLWNTQNQPPPGVKAVSQRLKEQGIRHNKQAAKQLFSQANQVLTNNIARHLGLTELDLTVTTKKAGKTSKKYTSLDTLLRETNHLFDQLPATPGGTPGQRSFNLPKLRQYLNNTVKNRRFQFIGLLAGVITTALAPSLNHYITKKVSHTDDYPAAEGLFHKPTALKNPDGSHSLLKRLGKDATQRLQSIAPYVTQQLEDGNPLPLLVSAIPLSVATGIFDTVNLKLRKPFGRSWKYLYDFSKKFPFVAQQQIASLYGILIAARIFTARVDHEFYERVIDGVTGFSIWILGAPFLKKLYAMGSAVFTGDKQQDNPLIKRVGKFKRRVLRSINEIQLLPDAKLNGVSRDTLINRLKVAGRGGLVTNIILLGLIEPLIAIFLTKRRSDNQQRASWQTVLEKLRPLENMPLRPSHRTPVG